MFVSKVFELGIFGSCSKETEHKKTFYCIMVLAQKICTRFTLNF